jgi:3-hydroxybutyryl-CoA dehydrogenase
VKRIGLVGCGIMGSAIAELAARSGLEVSVYVLDDEAAARGQERIAALLRRSARRDGLDEAQVAEVRARIVISVDIDELRDCELVIEAVPEIEHVKLDVFRQLAATVSPTAILASNTSSLSITRLAGVTMQPDRVVGLHFFNPASVLPLVELVTTAHTAPEVISVVEDLVGETLGKSIVRVPDTPGFIVNALLIPYICSAIRMVETGVPAASVDSAMTLGCSHPMGPLRLADLIGLDTVHSIASSLYEASGNPHDAPPMLLSQMVDAGVLGNKTQGGFYSR